MSRPKKVKSKLKSKAAPPGSQTQVEPSCEIKSATPVSTPDHSENKEHRVLSQQNSQAEKTPWSEWLWSEDGQFCYRGRKDAKGEWEYGFEPPPKTPKEFLYTPLRREPIEYLIEELKNIWEPRLVPDGFLVTATTTSDCKPSKGAAEDGEKAAKTDKGDRLTDPGKDSVRISNADEQKSEPPVAQKQDEIMEKTETEKHVVKRGRLLQRPERRHFNRKERKEKVEGWQKGLE